MTERIPHNTGPKIVKSRERRMAEPRIRFTQDSRVKYASMGDGDDIGSGKTNQIAHVEEDSVTSELSAAGHDCFEIALTMHIYHYLGVFEERLVFR